MFWILAGTEGRWEFRKWTNLRWSWYVDFLMRI